MAPPNPIRYIWETRIRDNSHLGVVDVSCQPAKAKVGKRKPSLLAAQQKEENAAQRLAAQQQQQHFQRQQQAYMQVRLVSGCSGTTCISSALCALTRTCLFYEEAPRPLLCIIRRWRKLSCQAAAFGTCLNTSQVYFCSSRQYARSAPPDLPCSPPPLPSSLAIPHAFSVPKSNGGGGAGAGFSMSGLQQPAPSSGSSRLFSGGVDGGSRTPSGGRVGPGGSPPGLAGSYDGAGVDDGMSLSGLASSGGGSGSRSLPGGDMIFGGQRMDRRGYGEQGVLLRTASGPPLDTAQRAALGGGVVKGEMSRVAGEEESLRKRPRESWR